MLLTKYQYRLNKLSFSLGLSPQSAPLKFQSPSPSDLITFNSHGLTSVTPSPSNFNLLPTKFPIAFPFNSHPSQSLTPSTNIPHASDDGIAALVTSVQQASNCTHFQCLSLPQICFWVWLSRLGSRFRVWVSWICFSISRVLGSGMGFQQ